MFVWMQKKIIYVLVLMSCCVLGITGLQLYWNYKNYKTTTSNFARDSNNALNTAVDQEIKVRKGKIISKVKNWLADTTVFRIECNIDNRDSVTVFTIQDVHPRFLEDSTRKTSFNMGINKFKEKLKKITPEAKKIFINHFTSRTLKSNIDNGDVFYYTQGLGDSIDKAFESLKFNPDNFIKIYKSELAKRLIDVPFQLIKKPNNVSSTLVLKANTSFRRPFEREPIFVSLVSANTYYWKEMKGLIFTSLLLIGITIFCFYYTIKTLLNQHKLVAIKNQFISNMTHEIHTPLSSIQLTTEALKKFNPDPETTENYLDIILYQTHKLNELTKEILANAKLETLTFELNEDVDLNQLIWAVIKELREEDAVKVKYLKTLERAIIKGNRKHLSRSIANILENAIKYNSTSAPVIEISLVRTHQTINLTIQDNGPGIADEFKQKIFEQFYRIPSGNIHDTKGFGLGLSYVKKVIEQHRGIISVLDNYPKGSVFSINLPG